MAVLLLAGLISGCYRYQPVQLGTVTPHENVRIHITEAAAARLVPEFGRYAVELDGQFAPEAHDSVSVAVTIGREYRGAAMESERQTLFLGRSEVVAVQRRQLSRPRTVLASTGLLVAFGLLVQTVVQWSDPNPSGEGPLQPPPPPGIRAVVSRIPFP